MPRCFWQWLYMGQCADQVVKKKPTFLQDGPGKIYPGNIKTPHCWGTAETQSHP
jgi:hypothetical protein